MDYKYRGLGVFNYSDFFPPRQIKMIGKKVMPLNQ